MRYLIDGCYGDGNVGDECLLNAIVRQIQASDSQASIAVLSADPAETERETGLPAIQQCNPFGRNIYGAICKGQLYRTIQAIRNCDVFILGGGELFRDDVGLRATLGMFYRMRLARWLGKRVLAFGVGAQPATRWWGRPVLRGALSDPAAIVFRDKDSLDVAQQLAPRLSHGSCAPDLVFSLDWSRFRTAQPRRLDPSDRLEIGVAVKSLPPRHFHFADVHRHLMEKLVPALSELSGRRPCRISVLSFAAGDMSLAETLVDELRQSRLDVANPVSPKISSLQQAISQMHCLLAVPLHASVFAFACGVPAVGLAYDAKIVRLYEAFEMRDSCLSVRGLTATDLLRTVQRTLDQRWEISRRLIGMSGLFAERVSRSVDDVFAAEPATLQLRITREKSVRSHLPGTGPLGASHK